MDAALRAFAGFEDEYAAREWLAEVRDARDAAQQRLERLGGPGATVTVNALADWSRLTVDERRALVRATVDRVTVEPGRGVARVTVQLLGQ